MGTTVPPLNLYAWIPYYSMIFNIDDDDDDCKYYFNDTIDGYTIGMQVSEMRCALPIYTKMWKILCGKWSYTKRLKVANL